MSLAFSPAYELKLAAFALITIAAWELAKHLIR